MSNLPSDRKNLGNSRVTAAIFLCSTATGLLPVAAEASQLDDKVSQINARYDLEWKRVRQDGDDFANSQKKPSEIEAVTKVKVDVGMNRIEWKLHIPEVVMRTQKIRLHLPQVSMKLKRIMWDNPEVTMTTTKCGQYPEWHGLWKVKFTDIKCDLPQVKMVRREAKLDLPEIRWDDTDIKLDLPEVTMKLQTWKFDVPTVTVRDVDAEMKKIRQKGEALQTRAADLQSKQKAEINGAVAEDLKPRRDEFVTAFGTAIKQLQDGIESIKKAGVDPTQLKSDDGETRNLIIDLENLKKQRDSSLATLDAEIAKGINNPS